MNGPRFVTISAAASGPIRYTEAMTQPIDTAKVTDRRALKFNSVGDLRADLESLDRAQSSRALRTTGNWTPGQVFGHLASFIEFAYDGYPKELQNPPWFIRQILKLMKKRYLYGKLPVGIKIPGIKDGTVGIDALPFAAGLTRLRAALARLDAAPPDKPNPIFGPLSHPEWIALHCRHAELHLSFLHPK